MPTAIHGFFKAIGWNMAGIVDADLNLILDKYQAIQTTIERFVKSEPLSQTEINELGTQLESDFETLCREVVATSFNNVADEHIVAFAKDSGQFLLLLYLAKEYTLLFQIAELLGIIEYKDRDAILIGEGEEQVILRYPGKAYSFNLDSLLALPVQFIAGFITELDLGSNPGLDSFIEAAKNKIDDSLSDIQAVYQESLAQGIIINISADGLTVRGNIFGFSQLDDPISIQLPPDNKLTLQINGAEISLLWGALLDEISQTVPAISAEGIQLQLGGKDALTADGDLSFHISENQTYFELKGRTGFELPAELIDGADVALESTGQFVFHYDAAGDYYLQLTELLITGNARFGGAEGLQLSDCRLSVQDIQYPLPPAGLDLKFQGTGTLSWDADGNTNEVLVQGDYTNERLMLSAAADLHLGNGIWLHVLEDQPILQAEINASGTYTFAVHALFTMPHQNGGTKDIDVHGDLTLVNANGSLQLTQFAAASLVNNLNWELPGGINLNSAGVSIAYENQTVSATISGVLKLEGSQTVQISAGLLLPDVNDPLNIRIDSLVQVSRLNFFDQLYLFEGQVKLSASTQPPTGSLEIIDGSGGFMAKGSLTSHPGLSDFHLAVDHLTTVFEFNVDGFELQMQAGNFLLPEVFNYGGDERAAVGIGDQPIVLAYENQRLFFQAALVLENLGLDFSEDGAPGFAALLESATLSLSSSEPIPQITDAKGRITLPIPSQDPLEIAFEDVEWDIIGYPAGSVYLAEDLSFPLGGGFELKLIGGMQDGINTGLTIVKQINALPQFIIEGALELVFPVDMLTNADGDQIYIGSSGNISWRPDDMPVPTLEELHIGGSFRLGGADGIMIREGELGAAGINNMLRPTEANPFQILLSGKVYLGDGGPGAGIKDASFTFTGGDYPLFDFQGFYVKPGEELLGTLEQLPLKVKELEMTFIESDPLPAKLDPTNIRVTLSAELELPLPSGGNLLGMVDDISIHFNEYGIPIRKDGSPGIDIGGIGMGIDNFEAGSIVLTGVVYLGGLDTPEDLFLAGKVGGKFNGSGVSALLALGTKGPRGLCLEVSGGSVGIPLPYGFLLTGAEGGVIFPNLAGRVSNADPCDIRTYIRLNDEGKPERTNQPAADRPEIPDDEEVILQPAGQAASESPEFECPQGECPPPAVSIISQPHPDRRKYPDRVIVKFTAIDEAMLRQLGITPAFFDQLGLTTPAEIAEATVGNLFDLVQSNFPNPAALPVPPETRDEVEALVNKLKTDTRNLLTRTFSEGIAVALNDNDSVYEAVKELAYAGIPSPETTLKLTGTFSYTGVSTFLSITGGFSISTVMIPQPVPLISTLGILGSINVLGIPMGTARLFLNTTDAGGTPLLLPTICGDVQAGVGPVEFGQMRMKFEAEGLTEGMADAGLTFARHLSGPLIHELVHLAAAEALDHPDYDPAQPAGVFSLLSFEQIVSFAGGLMNLPADRITPDIQACLVELMNSAWDSFNPKFLLCGQVQPKIFGFGLGAELTSAKINITKTSFAAQYGISPSFIISYFFGNIFPAIDKAAVGMAFDLPDPVELINKLLTTDMGSLQQLNAYLEEGFEHVLENAVYTLEYEIIPMGLKMADAEARIIMPDLLDHPAHPNSSWTRPEERTDQDYVSRLQLLLRALEVNVLANPLWKGSGEDLNDLTGNATHGLSMKNYFPHGGILGAAKLSLPLVLLDGIPPHMMAEIFKPGSDLLRRFNLAKTILDNYILKTEDIGQLAFYVPFPNPPTFTIDGRDLTPRQIVQKMQADGFDWSDIEAGELLSVEQAFFKGHISNARILGIPVLEAQVTAYGPDAAANRPGRFEIRAGVPLDSWLNQFVDRAELNFTLSQAPARPVDEYFRELLALMQYYRNHSGSLANAAAAVEIFSDADFRGRRQRLAVGDYRTRDLQIGNDQLSSIRIPADAGLQVVLYEGDNFQGRNIVLTDSVSGLGNFNEIVSSIRVVRATPLENLATLFTDGLPKMQMEASVSRLRIPDVLAGLIRVQANTSLLIKAYSPFYNPRAAGNHLDAQLQRNGGIYFAFQCRFGIPNIFEVDIPDARFALLPFSDTSILPKLIGEFTANRIDIPFGLPSMEQTRINFNSAPRGGENLAELSGQMSHLPLGLLNLVPTSGRRLSARLIVRRVSAGSPFDFRISPLKVQETGFLRSDLMLDGGAAHLPLTLKSAGTWRAAARGRRVALFAGQTEALRLSSNSLLTGSVAGNGFSNMQLLFRLPSNLQLTAFPNHPLLQKTISLRSGVQTILSINSNGAFSMQATVTAFNFGLIQISGAGSSSLAAKISNQGFTLSSGAKLHISGLTRTPFSLKQFTIQADATFAVAASGGKIGAANFFEISGGNLQISRTQTKIAIAVKGPSFYLFPATVFSNKLSIGNFSIDSSGYFEINSANQIIRLPGLVEIKGGFRFSRNRSGINGELNSADFKLLPLGLSLKGSASISSSAMKASLGAKAYMVAGLIELSPASWQLDWLKQTSLSLKANSPSLKILNKSLLPKGGIVIGCQSDSSFALSFATNSNLIVLTGLMEIGPASVTFTKSKTAVYNLKMNGRVKALKNPVSGQWILSQTTDINLTNGNFKKEITALRSKIFADVGLARVYSNNSSRSYFGRNNNAFYFEFNNLKLRVMGLENYVSGSCTSAGSLSLKWKSAKVLNLGPFRLTNRKAELSMNLKSRSFNVKVPAGKLTAPNVIGFPTGGINIPQINIGSSGDFTANLSAFTFNGIRLSTSGSSNYIKLYGKGKNIKIRNRKTLWGASAYVSLDINANGSVAGTVTGSFKLSNITVGSVNFSTINLGSVTMNYSSSRSGYQFEGSFTLNNISGKKKKTTKKKKNAWNILKGIWESVTETVVSWVTQTFKIRVTLKYGSAGAKAEVKVL